MLGVTLAFSAILAVIALVSSRAEFNCCDMLWLYLNLIPLTLGSIFLLVGGWLALHVLAIGTVHVWTVEDEDDSGTVGGKQARILWCIELNRRINTRKSNKVVASYSCMRNGIAALAITAIIRITELGISSI